MKLTGDMPFGTSYQPCGDNTGKIGYKEAKLQYERKYHMAKIINWLIVPAFIAGGIAGYYLHSCIDDKVEEPTNRSEIVQSSRQVPIVEYKGDTE